MCDWKTDKSTSEKYCNLRLLLKLNKNKIKLTKYFLYKRYIF